MRKKRYLHANSAIKSLEKEGVYSKTTRWVSDIAYIDNSATVDLPLHLRYYLLILHLEKHN
jgi:plasmid replication initiation protein